jgi:hypothetical protein
MANPEVSIRTDGLDDTSKARLREALQAAGLKMKEAVGPKVIPAEVGTIETTIHLDTGGVPKDRIEALRSVGFSDDAHSRALETVLKGALPGYGAPGATGADWVQWIWCEWLQYQANETFKKRYEIRPWGMASNSAAPPAAGGGW